MHEKNWPFQNPHAAVYFYFRSYICVCICLFVSSPLDKRKTIQTANLVHILSFKNGFFCFFEKMTLRAAILEKLPCHVDFPHISPIALSWIISSTIKYMIYTLKNSVIMDSRPWCWHQNVYWKYRTTEVLIFPKGLMMFSDLIYQNCNA